MIGGDEAQGELSDLEGYVESVGEMSMGKKLLGRRDGGNEGRKECRDMAITTLRVRNNH